MGNVAINVRRRDNLSGVNTGKDTNDFDILQIVGGVAVPLRSSTGTITTITEAQYSAAALLALLGTNFQNDSTAQRWFPIGAFEEVTPGNADAAYETIDYSRIKRFISRGELSLTARIKLNINSGERFNRLLHQSQGRLGFYWVVTISGEKYALMGKQTQSAAGLRSLIPHTMSDTTVLTPALPTGSTTTNRSISFTFQDRNALNGELGFIELPDNPLEANLGLIDILLTAQPGTSTGQIRVRVIGGVTNLIDDYATQLAVASNFKVTNETPGANFGATIAVSAVAVGTDGYMVLSTAATSGMLVRVSMAAPSVLNTNGLIGYESNSVTVTAP